MRRRERCIVLERFLLLRRTSDAETHVESITREECELVMKGPALRRIEREDGEEVRRLRDGAEAGINGELCLIACTGCVDGPLAVSEEDV